MLFCHRAVRTLKIIFAITTLLFYRRGDYVWHLAMSFASPNYAVCICALFCILHSCVFIRGALRNDARCTVYVESYLFVDTPAHSEDDATSNIYNVLLAQYLNISNIYNMSIRSFFTFIIIFIMLKSAIAVLQRFSQIVSSRSDSHYFIFLSNFGANNSILNLI